MALAADPRQRNLIDGVGPGSSTKRGALSGLESVRTNARKGEIEEHSVEEIGD